MYLCTAGTGKLLSSSADCNGNQVLFATPIGYLYSSPAAGRQALYECQIASATPVSHFYSIDSACEGQTVDGLFGYFAP